MDAFSGFEPQVGEIRALRTFRIGPDGLLYPLFSDDPWSAGVNTAHCRNAESQGAQHLVVEPGCTCGFYAYADEHAAAEYPNTRHVLAVVACWGRVVAGTRGLRSQHARIEVIWMSPTVPVDLAAEVADRYPSTVVYDDKDAMLVEHPPTHVDCYETLSPRDRARSRMLMRAAVTAALILGVLPWSWLTGNSDALILWAAALGAFLIASVNYGKRAGPTERRRALVCSATVLWLIAPLAGPAGILFLRLPILQIAVVAREQRRTALRRASRFPAEIG
ncbi:MAG: hypothetical protein QOG07_748 [Pseudonocardiales bacterium]|nr:hypothetical protein [Pseudonocardiales bacterium]